MSQRTTPKGTKPTLHLPPGAGAAMMAELRDRAQPKVCVAMMSAGQVDLMTMGSLLSVFVRQQQTGVEHLVADIVLESGPRIAEGRSKVVEAFLFAENMQHCDWLWMVDSDMTFEADALDRLLETAWAMQAKVVGGLCFAGGHSERVYPTIYRLLNDEDGVTTEPVADYEPGSVIKVGGTGAAFLLVHREVLAKMLVAFGTQTNGRPNPYPWFIEGMTASGKAYGEDVAFCIRAQQLGYGVYVDTSVKTGHRKTRALDEELYLSMQALIPEVEAPLVAVQEAVQAGQGPGLAIPPLEPTGGNHAP